MNALADVAFPALGTTAQVVTADASRIDIAERILRRELAAIDEAASRFLDDSEIMQLTGGRWTPVSDLLFGAIDTALRVARDTDGLVDPTVGEAVVLAGYDRDFGEIVRAGGPIELRATRVPGWRAVELDRGRRMVKIPDGVLLDLGASAKAFAADRAAARAAAAAGCGVLVNLGGDIAVAGDGPEGGWIVFVTDDHRSSLEAPGQTIAIASGGLATSGVTARRWTRGASEMHHIIDPREGVPAKEVWRTVSVAASSCIDANAASTASIILGGDAPSWLDARGLDARLVAVDGDVVRTGRWPR